MHMHMPPYQDKRPRGACRRWLMRALAVLLAALPIAVKAQQRPERDPALEEPDQRVGLWGQTTVVWQGHGRFRSPYQGENSLNGGGQGRETVSATPMLGVRLWQGGELYFNPEVFQGFGLANTHGLGGFSNGEAQKGGSVEPQAYVARAFYRHIIGLGGEQERIAADLNRLAATRDVSRLTFTLGRFAVGDIFDDNAYAHDPRTTFLNYALWAAGAFDYAADQKGYGVGAVAELNQRHWAFRIGQLLLPIKSNAQTLSWDLAREGQAIAELEVRHTLLDRRGVLRLLGWHSRANAGGYREALGAGSAFDGETSIWLTRRIRRQHGYAVNLEQAITDDLGLFARWSWRDAGSEVMSWADMDRSLSAGLSLQGTAWGRPQDTVGIGGAINRLSASHRDYTAAGGLGVTIGDGRLSYAGEHILETFYAIGIRPALTLTLDHQLVVNPAYNSDRGPVSLISMRVHGRF